MGLGKTKYNCMIKEHYNKMTANDIFAIAIDQFLTQQSSDMLLFAVVILVHRDPNQKNMKELEILDFRALNP